jgi:maleate isomerase
VTHRIGLIVPSSNTTMETELPELFRRRPERFTFHSARAKMARVTAEELDRMVVASDAAAQSLADAPVDAIGYACLVAVMARGAGAHRDVQEGLERALLEAPRQPPLVTSAGALVDALHALDAKRVALVMPYAPALADQVAGYIHGEGFDVAAQVALNVVDNVEVGMIPSGALVEQAARLHAEAGELDALVLSCCVQMPSLDVVAAVEEELGVPVVTAATATARSLLLALRLDPVVPDAGAALAEKALV